MQNRAELTGADATAMRPTPSAEPGPFVITSGMVDNAHFGKWAATRHTAAEVSMSRSNPHHRTGNAVNGAWRRARQAAARIQPAASQVRPMAKNAGTVAKHQADRTRAWAAPQIERASHLVQDSAAPKVSSLLSAAARRLEPQTPRRSRWRKVAIVCAAGAVASALTAAVRSRVKAKAVAARHDRAEAGDDPPQQETAPAMEARNGQRSPSSDVGQDSAARTS